jgi:hypothetical protein
VYITKEDSEAVVNIWMGTRSGTSLW